MSTLTPTQAMATFKVYKCSGTKTVNGNPVNIIFQHIIAPSPDEALRIFASYYLGITQSDCHEVPILQVPAGCSILSASGRHHFVS